MKTLNWQTKPLTAKQEKALNDWRFAADPSARLFTNFYTWTRWGVMQDYYTAMAEAKDIEDKELAREDLDATLKKLRLDYERDIDLFFEMKFAMHNAFCPVKLKIQWQAEERDEENFE